MHDCRTENLDNVQLIHDSLESIAALLGATVIKTSYHKFEPHGITCLFLVSSSHLAFHSYPEHSFATVDISVCKNGVAIEECIKQLENIFKPGRVECTSFHCGKEYSLDRDRVPSSK